MILFVCSFTHKSSLCILQTSEITDDPSHWLFIFSLHPFRRRNNYLKKNSFFSHIIMGIVTSFLPFSDFLIISFFSITHPQLIMWRRQKNNSIGLSPSSSFPYQGAQMNYSYHMSRDYSPQDNLESEIKKGNKKHNALHPSVAIYSGTTLLLVFIMYFLILCPFMHNTLPLVLYSLSSWSTLPDPQWLPQLLQANKTNYSPHLSETLVPLLASERQVFSSFYSPIVFLGTKALDTNATKLILNTIDKFQSSSKENGWELKATVIHSSCTPFF